MLVSFVPIVAALAFVCLYMLLCEHYMLAHVTRMFILTNI
jgi:hypothetical protein